MELVWLSPSMTRSPKYNGFSSQPYLIVELGLFTIILVSPIMAFMLCWRTAVHEKHGVR